MHYVVERGESHLRALVGVSVLGKCCIIFLPAHTALSLGKRKNELHIVELFDALLKNAYTVCYGWF